MVCSIVMTCPCLSAWLITDRSWPSSGAGRDLPATWCLAVRADSGAREPDSRSCKILLS